MTQDLASKVVLLTGATNGIGKAAALEFAKRGAKITIVGRNKQKTELVLNELKTKSGSSTIDYMLCDLSLLSEIRRMAEDFKSKNSKLDILINNAGATFKKPILGPDGYELTFALNHLAYFELTRELLGLILETPNARIISTASSMQARGKIDLKTIATSINRSGPQAYADSKLANILFTKELQRRLDGTSVTANCFEPGSVVTSFGGFGSEQWLLLNIIYAIARPFSGTPEQGADTLIWLATSDAAKNLKGEYVGSRKLKIPQKQTLDTSLQKNLWTLSEELVNQAL